MLFMRPVLVDVKGVEFWDASKTMQVLAEGHYFEGDCTSSVQWPHSLKAMLSEGGNCGSKDTGGWMCVHC